jgi:hypothetical protein
VHGLRSLGYAPELQCNEPHASNNGIETNDFSVKKAPSWTGEDEAFPTRRPIDYRPEFCELVVALGSDGLSMTEIAVEVGVTCRTLHDWCNANEEFEYAMTLALEAGQAYFERKGREGMFMGNLFNGAQWQFLMRTRFPEDYGDARDKDKKEPPQVVQFVMTEDDANL